MTSYIYDMVDTWNAGATTFTAVKMNVTDTASAAGSLLMDLQVGGSSKFSVGKDGSIGIDRTSFAPLLYKDVSNGQSFEVSIVGFTSNRYARFGYNVANGLPGYSTVSQGMFAFSNSASSLSVADLFLTRRAAANLRLGAADAAAPVAQTLSVQSVVAGTTNTAGANLTITGSQGTGSGAGGSIVFQVAPAGSSGTAQNALATALTINADRNVTLNGGLYSGSGNSLYLGNAVTFGGAFRLQDNLGAGIAIPAGLCYRWSSDATSYGTPDLILARDAANTLALRNGANGQTKNIYGTYTDASNYRRVALAMTTAGVATLKPEGAGTGASGNVLHISGLPTSNPGPGILWNNAGTVEVGT